MKKSIFLCLCVLIFGANMSFVHADSDPKGPLCAINGYTADGRYDGITKATCKILDNTAHFYLAPELIGKVDLIEGFDQHNFDCERCYGSPAEVPIPELKVYKMGEDIGFQQLFAIPHSVFKKYFGSTNGIAVKGNIDAQSVTATTSYSKTTQDPTTHYTVYGNSVGTVYELVVSGLIFATSSPGANLYLDIYNGGRANGHFDSSLGFVGQETISIASPVKGYDFTYTISQNKKGFLEVHEDSVTTRFEDGSKKTISGTAISTATTSSAQTVPSSWIARLWSWIVGFFR